MQLKKNSLNSKLYKWFYVRSNYNITQDFCTYARGTIWMYLIFIPYIVISMPWVICEAFWHNDIDKTSYRSFRGLLFYVVFWFLYGIWEFIGVIFFHLKIKIDSIQENAVYCGGVAIFLGILMLIIFGIVSLNAYLKDKPKSFGIIGEYVKAKKEKYCPRIDWID